MGEVGWGEVGETTLDREKEYPYAWSMKPLPVNVLERGGLEALLNTIPAGSGSRKRKLLCLLAWGLDTQEAMRWESINLGELKTWMGNDPKFRLALKQVRTNHKTTPFKQEAIQLYIGNFTAPVIHELLKVIFTDNHKDKVDAIKFFLKDIMDVRPTAPTFKFENFIKQLTLETPNTTNNIIEGEVREVED